MKYRLVPGLVVLIATLAWLGGAGFANAGASLHHMHGLAYTSDGRGLMIPDHLGLMVYREGRWTRVPGPAHDFMGFSMTKTAIYSSGHPAPDTALPNPLGLVKSTDGGTSWRQLCLAGEAEFHVMAAGYFSNAIYALNVAKNSRMPQPGLHFSHNDGKSWKRSRAAGLPPRIKRIAAHPASPSTLAVATLAGVYVSSNFGETFTRIGQDGPISAVLFDFDGNHIYFARVSPGRLKRMALDGTTHTVISVPELEETDFVAFIAQREPQARELAIATRRRHVFLSSDSGKTWKQIVRWGAPL